MILFFYIIPLDFNTLLQYQCSLPKVRVWKVVQIFIYSPLNFFIGCEELSKN